MDMGKHRPGRLPAYERLGAGALHGGDLACIASSTTTPTTTTRPSTLTCAVSGEPHSLHLPHLDGRIWT